MSNTNTGHRGIPEPGELAKAVTVGVAGGWSPGPSLAASPSPPGEPGGA